MEKVNASTEPGFRVLVGATAWLTGVFAAIFAGVFRVAPLVPLTLFGTLGALVILYRRGGALRTVIDRVDLRWAIAIHAIRAAVGWVFLWELQRDNIPELFAVRAGYGDIAVGLLAILVAAFAARRRLVVLAWNAIGLVDLLVAVGTAQYLLVIAGDPKMTVVATVPYALLPAVVVPIMLACHLLIFARLRRC
jgi:hypothetical protein